MYKYTLMLVVILLLTSCSKTLEESVESAEIPIAELNKQLNDRKRFIPFTELSEQEQIEYNKKMKKEFGEMNFGKVSSFTETDIRKAFPELNATDEKQTLCGNSIMGGATQIVFTSVIDDKKVEVKIGHCKPNKKGLFCHPLTISEKLYYERPGIFFDLEDDVSYDTALVIIQTYAEHGIDNIDEWYRRFTYEQIRTIGRSEKGYKLSLGGIKGVRAH